MSGLYLKIDHDHCPPHPSPSSFKANYFAVEKKSLNKLISFVENCLPVRYIICFTCTTDDYSFVTMVET